jgi:mRNA-degrading endonuclease RelE of RelBE toxin-antitoxin system
VPRYTVDLSRRAAADLEAFSPDVARRIATKLRDLEAGAHPRGDTAKRLQGFDEPTFRLRIGDYRAVYRLGGAIVVVLRVIHRSELHRALRDLR